MNFYHSGLKPVVEDFCVFLSDVKFKLRWSKHKTIWPARLHPDMMVKVCVLQMTWLAFRKNKLWGKTSKVHIIKILNKFTLLSEVQQHCVQSLFSPNPTLVLNFCCSQNLSTTSQRDYPQQGRVSNSPCYTRMGKSLFRPYANILKTLGKKWRK